MLKGKIARKLSRKKGQRKALLSSLTREFFKKQKIETTEAKAREVARVAEKIITKAKTKSLASRKNLYFLNTREVKAFLDKGISHFAKRNGGYTRITKLGPRPSDGAKMAVVEFVK